MKEKRQMTQDRKIKNVINSNKAITLIALVITIIVLLILAGVTIATLTGDNGILTQASKAKDKSTEAEAIERVRIEVLDSYGTEGNLNKDLLKQNVNNEEGMKVLGEMIDDDKWIVNTECDGKKFTINQNGKIYETILPEEYVELKYIEATGNQYIETGVTFRNNLRTEIKYQFTKLDTNSSLLGAYMDPAGTNGYMMFVYRGEYGVRIGGPLTILSSINVDTNIHEDVISNRNGILVHDGVEYGSEYTGYAGKSTEIPSKNIPIFCHMYTGNGVRQWYSCAKLYNLKFYDELTGECIGNYIPAKSIDDGSIGLYDIVGEQFYKNKEIGEDFLYEYK